MTRPQIKGLVERGDEIASHTVNHLHLPQLTQPQLDAELRDSQVALRKMFGPEPRMISPLRTASTTT